MEEAIQIRFLSIMVPIRFPPEIEVWNIRNVCPLQIWVIEWFVWDILWRNFVVESFLNTLYIQYSFYRFSLAKWTLILSWIWRRVILLTGLLLFCVEEEDNLHHVVSLNTALKKWSWSRQLLNMTIRTLIY